MNADSPVVLRAVRYKLRAEFVIERRFRPLLRLIGVRPSSCDLELDRTGLRVSFGRWQLTTPVANIAGAEVTGPYNALKAIGPRLSLADGGLTFGTSTAAGLCVAFHQPVRGIEPLGLIRHPSLTATIADPDLVAGVLRTIATRPSTTPTEAEDPAMADDEEWQNYLTDVEYPCQRDVLLQKAAASGGGDDILGRIGKIPEQQYDDLDAVRTALRQR